MYFNFQPFFAGRGGGRLRDRYDRLLSGYHTEDNITTELPSASFWLLRAWCSKCTRIPGNLVTHNKCIPRELPFSVGGGTSEFGVPGEEISLRNCAAKCMVSGTSDSRIISVTHRPRVWLYLLTLPWASFAIRRLRILTSGQPQMSTSTDHVG
jgi:hypothetical protein